MSFGKLYGFAGNARSTVLLVLAKACNLDIELVETFVPNKDPEYRKLNPLSRVPTFVGPNGFVLTESIAIALYFASKNDKGSLLGGSTEDYYSIIRWMSFSNSEVLPPLGGWFRPLTGRDPYDEKYVEASKATTLESIGVLEQHFSVHPFLVKDTLSVADLYLASELLRGFQYTLDRQWRLENPHVTAWYKRVTGLPMWRSVIEEPIFVDEAVKHDPSAN